MLINLLIYFVVGIVQDYLWTLNVRYVAQHRVLPASLSSFFTTVVSMLVLYNILSKLDSEKSILAILIYSLGIAVGTVLGMKSHKITPPNLS